MKLICAHCRHYDSVPLSSVPRGWVDIVPDPTSPPATAIGHKTPAGTIADTFGICPVCAEHRRTAFVADPETPVDDTTPDMLF